MNTLDRLKELSQQATPGPWRVVGSKNWQLQGFPQVEMPDEKMSYFPVDTDANAALIVTLHNALPDLLAVVEAAKWVRETTNHAYVLNQAAVKGALNRLDAALAKLEKEAPHED